MNTLRKYLSNPLIPIAILVLFSVLVLVIHSLEYAVLSLLLALVFAIAVGVKPKKLLTSLSYATSALLFYTTIASIIQVILLGYVDAYLLLLTIIRIEALVAMSVAIVESIDIVKLISLSRRTSARIALAIALSLKMIRDFSRIWRTVKDTYSVNLRVKGFRKRVYVYILMMKVFLTLALYSAIQTAEAVITRRRLYTKVES